MATGFPVKANYATGDVLTAANMNDLSGTVNYLQYMTPRNAVLNSNFSVWQRGTSFVVTGTGTGYTADRWLGYRGVVGSTISRQTTNDTTNLPNIQYCLRVQRDSGNTSTSQIILVQNFESVNSIPFAGKAVTLSFYARAGANYSATANALPVYIYTGTGTDQNLISGYTGSAASLSGTATLTTTWQRFSFTATLPTNTTELAIDFPHNPTGTAGAADYFEVTGVQLELGSSANTYMPNQPTYQGELAACQRYYYRQTAGGNYGWMAYGGCQNTTNGQIGMPLPVQMRTTPSTTIEYANIRVVTSAYAGTFTSMVLNTGESTPNMASFYFTGTGYTAGYAAYLGANNNTAAYVGVSAEL